MHYLCIIYIYRSEKRFVDKKKINVMQRKYACNSEQFLIFLKYSMYKFISAEHEYNYLHVIVKILLKFAATLKTCHQHNNLYRSSRRTVPII